MQITASENKNGTSITVEFDPGESLEDMVKRFGEETVKSHASRSIVIALQAHLRAEVAKGKTQDEIQATVKDWRPGERRKGKSLQEKVRETLGKLSPQERAALLKEYRTGGAAGAARQ